jgi:hypothetical protein
LLLELASAVILGYESLETCDHILLSQVRDSPNLEGEVAVFISPGNRVAQLYPQALVNSIQFSFKHSAQTPRRAPIIVDVFTVKLLRNGLHNSVVLLLLGADDIENTVSSIVA